MNNNSKHPLEWFEDRIGSVIYRAPIFSYEQTRDFVAVKVKDKAHAKTLFELQRRDRPAYTDNPKDVRAAA